MADSVQSRSATSSAPPPVPLACTECRNRHMKCDAKTPVCSRCKSESRQCQYIQSRRGYRGPRKRRALSGLDDGSESQTTWESESREINTISFQPSDSAATWQSACKHSAMTITKPQAPQLLPLETTTPFSEDVFDHTIFQPTIDGFEWPLIGPISDDQSVNGCRILNSSQDPKFSSSSVNDIEDINFRNGLNLYYLHFHDSHPILLPRKLLLKPLFEQYPSYLKKIMQYIGFHYESKTSADLYQTTIDQEISNDNSKSGYLVQALLLYAITLHARDKQKRAKQTMDNAVEMAIDLGMHLEQFATENGCGSRHLEECWRKTWWELYIVDGMLNLHMQLPFRPWNIEMSVLLPKDECLDSDAIAVRNAHTLSSFRERAFAKDEVVYSSFAYRIEAARLVGRILALSDFPHESDDNNIEAIDAGLTSWILHLPPSKREVVDHEGKVDEMLFQAHMLISAGLIYLHRPRSNLVFTTIQEKTQCTRPEQYLNPTTSLHIHAAKAIRAANNLSNLIALPVALVNHTPFFACAVTLSAIIHLAAYSVIAYADGGAAVKERVQMEIGALKAVGGVWPVAGEILMQVKEVARGIFVFDKGGVGGEMGGGSGSGVDGMVGGDDLVNFVGDGIWAEEILDS